MNTSVVVVEDDDFTRWTLRETLEGHGYTVVADCATAAEAFAAQKLHHPRVALLDLDLGRGPNGIDVAGTLRRNDPSIGIVFLTSFDDPRLISSPGQLLPAGAQYLVKKSVGSVSAIRKAMEKSLVSRKVRPLDDGFEGELRVLSAVQLQTLWLVAEGFTNAEVAKRQNITLKAAELQLARIATKLGIERDPERNLRVALVRAYLRQPGGENNDSD
jgi:DNA-binding NarL/FixJ family response regulator